MWGDGRDMLTGGGRQGVETAAMLLPSLAVTGTRLAEVPVAWQSAAAAVFFVVSPGMAVLAPARFRWEIELAVLVPTSLAVTSLVSLALFEARIWTPTLMVVALSALCAVGIVGVAFRGPDSRTASYPDGGSPGGPAPRWEDAT